MFAMFLVVDLGRLVTEVVVMTASATPARTHAPIQDHHVCCNTFC